MMGRFYVATLFKIGFTGAVMLACLKAPATPLKHFIPDTPAKLFIEIMLIVSTWGIVDAVTKRP
jgi:hypothetical protein